MSTTKINRYHQVLKRRQARIRAKIVGQSHLPRLSIHRTNKYIYAQVVNQTNGVCIAGIKGSKPEEVGEKIAVKAIAAGVKEIVFDRGGYNYHGKVKLLAEAARKGGLVF